METQEQSALPRKKGIPGGVLAASIWFFLSMAWFSVGIVAMLWSSQRPPLFFDLLFFSLFLVFACPIAGISILFLKNWARILAIIVLVTSVLLTCASDIQLSGSYDNIASVILGLIFSCVVNIGLIWYLVHAKNSF